MFFDDEGYVQPRIDTVPSPRRLLHAVMDGYEHEVVEVYSDGINGRYMGVFSVNWPLDDPKDIAMKLMDEDDRWKVTSG
jgi:hypothetical protein